MLLQGSVVLPFAGLVTVWKAAEGAFECVAGACWCSPCQVVGLELVVMVLFQKHAFTLALRFTAVDVCSGVVSEVLVFTLAKGRVVDPGTESGAVARVALDEELG
jgi:hypothetical protein